MLLWCWTINWESGINVALLVAQLLFGSRLLILINFAQLHIDIPSLGWTSTLHTFIWLANMFTEYVHKGVPSPLRIILFTGGGVGSHVPDICHHRHHRRWCTFFKPAYLFKQST